MQLADAFAYRRLLLPMVVSTPRFKILYITTIQYSTPSGGRSSTAIPALDATSWSRSISVSKLSASRTRSSSRSTPPTTRTSSRSTSRSPSPLPLAPTVSHMLTLRSTLSSPRVEAIASTTALDVDFSGLRAAIRRLQVASAALDAEKHAAEHALRKVLRRFAHRHFWRRTFRSALCRLGASALCPGGRAQRPSAATPAAATVGQEKPFECASMRRGGASASGGMLPFRPHARAGRAYTEDRADAADTFTYDRGRAFPWKKLRAAVRRVRAANAKLVAFERGFVHPEGIKDREWYRNLDVAPGKWLGESRPSRYRWLQAAG